MYCSAACVLLVQEQILVHSWTIDHYCAIKPWTKLYFSPISIVRHLKESSGLSSFFLGIIDLIIDSPETGGNRSTIKRVATRAARMIVVIKYESSTINPSVPRHAVGSPIFSCARGNSCRVRRYLLWRSLVSLCSFHLTSARVHEDQAQLPIHGDAVDHTFRRDRAPTMHVDLRRSAEKDSCECQGECCIICSRRLFPEIGQPDLSKRRASIVCAPVIRRMRQRGPARCRKKILAADYTIVECSTCATAHHQVLEVEEAV